MKKTISQWICAASLILVLGGCDKNGNINLLSLEEDKKLGLQVSQEIANNEAEYPLLPETGNGGKNEIAYREIRRITDKVLNSGKLTYRNDFAWQVKIIDQDVKNAFCTPGGYIYVYTGLIKYLDTEDQLAGVMGHEIGHADKRHTSRTMTKQYGYDIVVKALLGNSPSTITQIALGLKNLQNSREYEREADDASVVYLSGTDYQCSGAAGFFEKIEAEGGSNTPQFLSTHPNPDNRIKAIKDQATKLGCTQTPLNPSSFQTLKNSLP
jgi:Zn-dependent protease with chaperone function